MQTTKTGHTHEPTACDRAKASLSAYLDDELPREERLTIDAHLVGCGACRGLVERAEALDNDLRARFASDEAAAAEALGDEGVSVASIEAGVLAAIRPESAGAARWWPRIAAAAVVVAAVGGSLAVWNSRDIPESLRPAGPGEFGGSFAGAPPRVAPPAVPSGASVRLASLSVDDRQALYATSLILDNARRTAFVDEDRRVELRETVRYDELVDRLDALLPKLPAEERETVALARDLTERLVDAADDPREWVDLQQQVEARGLAPSIEILSSAR
jgi:hypothetical protein